MLLLVERPIFSWSNLISGGTVTILYMLVEKNTFIKQFMNEGRLRRILGHCTFSVSTSFCSKHVSKARDHQICFCFIPSPIVSNCSCHHCCLFYSDHAPIIIPTWVFCAATSSTSSSHFFCVDAQLLEEMQMWHEFGRTMERMSHPVRLNCFCHALVWLSVVCKGSK